MSTQEEGLTIAEDRGAGEAATRNGVGVGDAAAKRKHAGVRILGGCFSARSVVSRQGGQDPTVWPQARHISLFTTIFLSISFSHVVRRSRAFRTRPCARDAQRGCDAFVPCCLELSSYYTRSACRATFFSVLSPMLSAPRMYVQFSDHATPHQDKPA